MFMLLLFKVVFFNLFFFFFQAEDGIRDVAVTGVQTCALPISSRSVGQVACRRPCCRNTYRGISSTASDSPSPQSRPQQIPIRRALACLRVPRGKTSFPRSRPAVPDKCD